MGSIYYQHGYFHALFVMDIYSREKLVEMAKKLRLEKGSSVTLVIKDPNQDDIEATIQQAWSHGEIYVLFE